MPIILNGTTGITTPGITNTGPFTFQGVVELPAGAVGAPSLTTTGDTNTGIYFPAADTIGFVEGGVEALRINSSAQIAVNTAGTAGAPVITKTDDLNTGIFFPAADTIAFAEGGVESMRIDASGNLGLGVTPSAWSTAGNLQLTNLGSKVNGVSFANNAYFDSGWKYASNGFAGLYSQVNGQHIFYTAPTGTINNAVSLTQAMTLDASGNLGIGTSSPGSKLEVSGVGTFTAGTQETWGSSGLTFGASRLMRQMENTSTAREYICGPDTSTYGTYEFYTARSNGSPTLAYAVSAAGNVGIGTSSPGAKLDVASAGTVAARIYNTSSTTDAYLICKNSSGESYFGVNATGPYIYTATAQAMVFHTNNTERARITSGGDFLVGGTSVATSDASAPQINCISSTTTGGQWSSRILSRNTGNDASSFLGVYKGASLVAPGVFAHNAALNAWATLYINTIDGSGSGSNGSTVILGSPCLVNTTGLANNGVFSVNTTTSTPAARFYSSSGDGAICVMVDKSSSTNTTSQWFLGFTINAQTTASGVITANGASQAAFGSWSDQRLKKNIVDIPSQWANIKALRPVEFDYIESEGGGHQTSFIAQEFEQVYPDAIGERPDGMKTLTGWGKTEARLVKVLQEAMLRIEQLEADMAVMKGLN